jgi:hypothetical protein
LRKQKYQHKELVENKVPATEPHETTQ